MSVGAPPGNVDGLIEALAQEASPLRRRQILMAAKDAWDAHTVVDTHPWPEAQERADEIVTA